MVLDLQEKHIDFIKNTVNDSIPGVDIFVYNSREQQKYNTFLDIVLLSNEEISIERILKLETMFQYSDLPYKVDIIDLRTLKESCRNIIKANLYKLQ